MKDQTNLPRLAGFALESNLVLCWQEGPSKSGNFKRAAERRYGFPECPRFHSTLAQILKCFLIACTGATHTFFPAKRKLGTNYEW
jgi:hypothetical protein